MFAHRYFTARYFAPRYFPLVPTTVSGGLIGKRKKSSKQWHTLPNGMRVYGTERSFKTLLDRQHAEPEVIERKEDAKQAEAAAELAVPKREHAGTESGASESGGSSGGDGAASVGARELLGLRIERPHDVAVPVEYERETEVERVAKGVAAEQFRREELQRRAQEEIERIAQQAIQAAEAFRLEQERREIAFENEMLLALILEDMEP